MLFSEAWLFMYYLCTTVWLHLIDVNKTYTEKSYMVFTQESYDLF